MLCDKSYFVIQILSGGGSDPSEASETCLGVSFANTLNQGYSSIRTEDAYLPLFRPSSKRDSCIVWG